MNWLDVIARGLRVRAMAVSTAALMLSGCVWSSQYPLMSIYAVERSPPISLGAYRNYDQRVVVVESTDGNVANILWGESRYSVVFSRIEQNYFLAQAIKTDDRAIAYVVVETLPNGFSVYGLDCDEMGERSIAVAAGAYVDADTCMFTQFDQLVAAMRVAVRRIRADPEGAYPDTYTR